MSCPCCVDSVGIRILGLRSSKCHSRQANDAERIIFRKITIIKVFSVSCTYISGLDASGGRKL